MSKAKTSLFIRNYPRTLEPSVLINNLTDEYKKRGGQKIIIPQQDYELCAGGLKVTLSDQYIINYLKSLNGLDLGYPPISNTLYTLPLFIINFPEKYSILTSTFRKIFGKYYDISTGSMNLNNLVEKVKEFDKSNHKLVNFSDELFVEFLFFQLGVDSFDMKLPIYSISLNQNQIENFLLISKAKNKQFHFYF